MRGSLFGNPNRISPFSNREQVVAEFRVYLWRRIQTDREFAQAVRELHNRTLCCCCKPLPCHGDVLERAAAFLNTTRGLRY